MLTFPLNFPLIKVILKNEMLNNIFEYQMKQYCHLVHMQK